MALVRWEPFREIDTLQRRMNRLFDELAPLSEWQNGGELHAPAAELEDAGDELHLSLEVPGMKPEDLDIEVTADAVTISGERKSETKTEEKGVFRTEFRYGQFQRRIGLPARVQNANAIAHYENGILKLTLPKAEEEKNKVVKVSVN